MFLSHNSDFLSDKIGTLKKQDNNNTIKTQTAAEFSMILWSKGPEEADSVFSTESDFNCGGGCPLLF